MTTSVGRKVTDKSSSAKLNYKVNRYEEILWDKAESETLLNIKYKWQLHM